MKGEASFWYPYFQIVNKSDLPFLWERSQIRELQDAVLESNIENYRVEFEIEWETFHKLLCDHKYDHIIPGVTDPQNERALREKYIEAFLTVVTRCFGWGLPCTTLVPFADCINHHNVDSSYDMIKAEWMPMTVLEREEKFSDFSQATGLCNPILNFSQKIVEDD